MVKVLNGAAHVKMAFLPVEASIIFFGNATVTILQ